MQGALLSGSPAGQPREAFCAQHFLGEWSPHPPWLLRGPRPPLAQPPSHAARILCSGRFGGGGRTSRLTLHRCSGRAGTARGLGTQSRMARLSLAAHPGPPGRPPRHGGRSRARRLQPKAPGRRAAGPGSGGLTAAPAPPQVTLPIRRPSVSPWLWPWAGRTFWVLLSTLLGALSPQVPTLRESEGRQGLIPTLGLCPPSPAAARSVSALRFVSVNVEAWCVGRRDGSSASAPPTATPSPSHPVRDPVHLGKRQVPQLKGLVPRRCPPLPTSTARWAWVPPTSASLWVPPSPRPPPCPGPGPPEPPPPPPRHRRLVL